MHDMCNRIDQRHLNLKLAFSISFCFFDSRAVFESRGGLPVVVDPIEAVGLEPTTGAPSAETNSDTKKVSIVLNAALFYFGLFPTVSIFFLSFTVCQL